MPRKIRELKAELRRAGFRDRPGKGSHRGTRLRVGNHPALPETRLTIGRRDGQDVPEYLERQARAALAALTDRLEEQP